MSIGIRFGPNFRVMMVSRSEKSQIYSNSKSLMSIATNTISSFQVFVVYKF